jgi:hypothetical protein
MVLSTGSISFNDLQNEMGGSNPISLNEYFRDNSSKYAYAVTAVPKTGNSISMSHFRGASKASVPATTTYSVGKDATKEINIYKDTYWTQTIKINIYWVANEVIRTDAKTRSEARTREATGTRKVTRTGTRTVTWYLYISGYVNVGGINWPVFSGTDQETYTYEADETYTYTQTYYVDVNYNVDVYGDVNKEALLSTSVIYADNYAQFSVTKNVNEGSIDYLDSNRLRYTYTNTRNGEYFVNIVYSQPP